MAESTRAHFQLFGERLHLAFARRTAHVFTVVNRIGVGRLEIMFASKNMTEEEARHLTDASVAQVMEQGEFFDGTRTGSWIIYACSGGALVGRETSEEAHP